MEQTRTAASKPGVELLLLEAASVEAIDQAFKRARERGADAISVIHIGLMGDHRPRIAQLALDAQLPAIYSDSRFALEGGLAAYSPDTPDQHRRAAMYVGKILKGAKPADLPDEQPTKFELVFHSGYT